MKTLLTTIFCGFILFTSESIARDSLASAARNALPATISTEQISNALTSALWNPEHTACAVVFGERSSLPIFVFIKKHNGDYLAVDVSPVEKANFGKLGNRKVIYTRHETTPTEWLPRTDGLFQVVVRTRAWVGEQRSTVQEPLIIKPDGTPIWR